MRELTINEISVIDGAASADCGPDLGDTLLLVGMSIVTGLGFAAGGLPGAAALLGLASHGKNMYDKGQACEAAKSES